MEQGDLDRAKGFSETPWSDGSIELGVGDRMDIGRDGNVLYRPLGAHLDRHSPVDGFRTSL